MTWGYVAVAGATLVSGYMSSQSQSEAVEAQQDAAAQAVAEQRRQFDTIQQMLSPYAQGGEKAVLAQQALVGLGGPTAQRQAIAGLEQSPFFTSMLRQGENAIRQNASATGGLRGGNTQAALAQFRPQLLSQALQQQYQNLGGLTGVGQNAAAMTGNAGMTSAGNIGNILQGSGEAQAAGILGQQANINSTIGNLAGLFASSQNQPAAGGGGSGGGGGGLLGSIGGLF